VRRVSIEGDRARKKAIQAAILGIIVVAVLLGLNGYRTLELDRDNTLAWEATQTWLQGTPYTVNSITLTYNPSDALVKGPANAVIGIAGTGPLPDIKELSASLEKKLGYPVTVQVRILPEQITYYPEARPPGGIKG
jgi:hypothetical protein